MSEEAQPVQPPPSTTNPDIDSIQSLNLYTGTRVRHDLLYGVVKDRKTGALHHDYVTLKTSRKTKTQPWKPDPKASFTLSEDKAHELSQALTFILKARAEKQIATPDLPVSEPLNSAESASAVPEFLTQTQDLMACFQAQRNLKSLPELAMALEQETAADLNSLRILLQIASARKALRGLHQRLKQPETRASEFLEFLQQQSWLLGHENSQIEDLPEWIRETQAHLLLFRRPTGEQELWLIKTPFHGEVLFEFDEPHQATYPSDVLLLLLGQVQSLLEKLSFEQTDASETSKNRIQAKILVGMTQDQAVQTQALVRLNRHLNQLEILSFDQLESSARERLQNLQALLKQV
ncbi:hypothetical protein COW36_19485 [bacterium (Candidatus Blackallbacteria) CG17_big_fil_post_rev_8_21_14_2_50_48_46]|uniref:Uncharacterized protein n=1 Tax=bacterium (Candidatus Blackallbacteria) CG17_big_fil_post_rev_8_21_14_2_50_48_46 TaxID=2014261 RepID=A0A2M7FZJ3_9BACT|nr:MAG: hypothetical protein COW64_15810 [bacterium (Candidatus Blackallbacteria) CG18_big_fil_WC_8_21_14_2_50_49_26]PIW14835.1 MAG: hypothetical protein COW36_19485 [bacterium (Candidatus Blackallbacteria) CG17_big_fil_post_rev_8_21_14_2_50_48_46]PIW44402.1 MAG: hypothetical protein COW20_24060 [bacterium (Candidatus Blackallbacteria) CG13_big_fil_rev_8_21_14_2_50_49_14]